MPDNEIKRRLDAWFDELMRALDRKTVFVNQSDDPVFYLVYPPRWALSVYSMLPEWKAKLRHRNWTPREFNVGLEILNYLKGHADRDVIVAYEKENPDAVGDVTESLRDLLRKADGSIVVEDWILDEIESSRTESRGVLILTGIELLHPLLQIGNIEQRLQGKFSVPGIVCYPGERTSSFGLRYLGIYDPDGTYRSRHFGGRRV